MKKFVLLILILAISTSSWACDICGCGVGSYYVGILPEFKKRIVGLRYRFNSLQTHLGAGGTVSYLTTSEKYHTTELWGAWAIGNKFRITSNVPLHFIDKSNAESHQSKTGLGDIGVQAFYKVFDSRGMAGSRLLLHSLWAGVGVKLPTGKYQSPDPGELGLNPNIYQLGTGSWDATLNAMYDIRIHDAGLNVNASYKMNSTNGDDYRYGNKFSGAAQLYHKFRIGQSFSLAPNLGCTYETAGRDQNGKLAVDASGGHISFGSLGLEMSFNKINIGANWQTPLSQRLANGFVKSQDKAMVHVSLAF